MKTVYNFDEIPTVSAVQKNYNIDYFGSKGEKAIERSNDYERHQYAVSCAWNNRQREEFSQYLCHYYVINGMDSGTTYLWNSLTHQCSKSASRYINWLLSDKSPYAPLFEGDDVYLFRDKKDEKPILIAFTSDVNKLPVRLLCNFLIATRLQSGWGLNHVWDYLVNQGFTEDTAFLLTSFFSWSNQTVTYQQHSDSRHGEKPWLTHQLGTHGPYPSDQPLNLKEWKNREGVTSILDHTCFYERKYNLGDKVTLSEGGTGNPCNIIWDGVDSTSIGFKRALDNPLANIKNNLVSEKSLPDGFVSNLEANMRKGVLSAAA